MDPESAKALFEAFQSFDADETASVAVFWGEGGAFCAGWDLKHSSPLTQMKQQALLFFGAKAVLFVLAGI
jgi:enoyl-CoA hydratase/carnithine racemase